MSKPKEKKNTQEVYRKKEITHYDRPQPFDAHDNDKIGHVDSKERV